MATIRLIPSAYYLSNSTYLSVSNASNMYHNTDNDTYATVTNSRSSTTSYYIYVRGFNFDAIDDAWVVNSITIKVKGYESGVSTSTSYAPRLYNGTTSISTASAASQTFSTSTRTITVPYTGDWATLKSYGSNLGIRCCVRRASSSTTGYLYLQGAEIEVDYTIPTPRTITSTLSGSGTISPSGAQTYYDGDEYELTITPTNKSDTVTAIKDGVDITSQLVAHGVGSTVTLVPADVTTSGIQSGSSYAEYAIGHSAESPYSSTSNMYASQSSTGYAAYSFDFSGIPSNATIENIEVRCHGHRESSTISSTYVSKCGIYNGSTLISEYVEFPSTTASIITLEPNTTVTRSMLDNLVVRHYVGYYGGLVTGISFEVEYSTGTGIDHYTYTYTVNADATIAVTIGGGGGDTSKIYVKIGGTWKEATPYKKVNGSWVLQTDVTSVFDSTKKYVKGN